jgi:peptide/nickel transport system substrate-binding protein
MSAKEAPALAELVKQGKLPPLAQRLPKNPLVVTPYEAPGYYGGTWHLMVDNPDLGMYKMIAGYAPLMRWSYEATKLVPGTATDWQVSPDGSKLTIHLRKGIRWSDGEEFTSEDILYWAQLCTDGKQRLTWPFWALVDSKPPVVTAPDKYTLIFQFAGPNWYVPLHMATGFWWSDEYNTPKHYLKQFDPKYNKDYKDYSTFDKKNFSHFNPDRPTLWPWKLKAIEEGGFRMVFERNPYYYMVDNLGRQLPYIDTFVATYVPNAQVRVLKILAGEIDAQFRLIETRDLGLYNDGRKRGDYRVIMWKEAAGGSTSLLVNWTPPDAQIRELLRDLRFRKALSHAIDRDKCNQVAWRGLGRPQQATVSREGWHFRSSEGKKVFEDWAQSYTKFDIALANRYLDEMGLTKRDAQGYRLRKDGKRITLTLDCPPAAVNSVDTDEALIVRDGWEKLGIEIILHNWPSAEYTLRQKLGKFEISMHGEGEMDLFTYPDWVFPTTDVYWHGQVGKWYKTGGKEGEAPEGVMKELLNIYDTIKKEKNIEEAHKLVQKAVRLHTEGGLFAIGTVADTPAPIIAKNRFRNIPTDVRILGPWAIVGPATSFPETFFFAPKDWTPPSKNPQTAMGSVSR